MKFNIEGGDFTRAGFVASEVKKQMKQLSLDAPTIKRVVMALYEAEVNVVAHVYRGRADIDILPEKIHNRHRRRRALHYRYRTCHADRFFHRIEEGSRDGMRSWHGFAQYKKERVYSRYPQHGREGNDRQHDYLFLTGRRPAMTSKGKRGTRLYEHVSADNLRYLKNNIRSAPLAPMTKLIYQGSIQEVLEKMDSAKKIHDTLPGIDCGAYGSPTCKSLAQYIVCGEATETNCIFIQRTLEHEGNISSESLDRLLEEIWGRKPAPKN